ncbi:MAG: hypothetical protein JWP74_536 [Marmoricola sp.]|nr:hypothetical protein [Marmoricola sp.]
MTHFRRVAVVAATGSLLFVAGCGAHQPAALDKPSGSPTSVSVTAGTQSGTTKATFVRNLLSAIDSKTSVHITVSSGPMGSGAADISYGAGPTTIEARGTENRHRTMFVVARGIVYVQQGPGGKFLMIGKNDPSYGSLLRTFTNIGPHDSVAGFGKGIVSATKDKAKNSNGLSAYRLVVDPTKATGAFRVLMGSSGISELMTFEFYVDSGNLLRRITATVDGQHTIVNLTRWGKPVSIAVPTSSDLVTPAA